MHDRCLSSCELYTMSLLQLNVKITACKYIAITRQDRWHNNSLIKRQIASASASKKGATVVYLLNLLLDLQ